MSALHVLGVNHHHSLLPFRERLAFNAEELPGAVNELCRLPEVCEAAVLSTCGRTEIYCNLEKPGTKPVRDWLSVYHRLEQSQLEAHLCVRRDAHMVRHLMRVTSGLDSVALGETQVLGQVKEAYQAASRVGGVGPLLGRLFQDSFSVAKQVRSHTSIGAHSVSIPTLTLRLARQIFGDMEACRVLLLGAGDTIRLILRHLRELRLTQVVIANRDTERAWQLARRCGARAVPLQEAAQCLEHTDLVISAAGSSQLLTRADFKQALAGGRRRPVFVADLGVPRNLDPAIGGLRDIYFYTVDDLRELSDQNMAQRLGAVQSAECLIEERVSDFMAWLQSRDAITELLALRERGDVLRRQVLEQAQRLLKKGADPTQVLEQATDLLTRKLLHGPTVRLRKAVAEGRDELREALRTLHTPERD